MAEKLGIPRTTCAYRLNALLEKKIIEREIYHVDASQFSFQTYVILIRLCGERKKAREKIKAFSDSELHVTLLLHTLGPSDFEMVVELEHGVALTEFCSRLYIACGQYLEAVQSLPVLKQKTSEEFLGISTERKASM
jgi:DNA-binding Lrp family transcriptional regulator